jgi:hypothetical protein
MPPKSRKSDRDGFAKWPAGWRVEADRLATLYRRNVEYDGDLMERRTAACELSELATLVGRVHGRSKL